MKDSSTVKEEWNAIIASKLKKGVSLEDLNHEYPSGIVMEPNVLSSDIAGYDHKVKVTAPWINMASIQDGNSEEKNKLSLQALQQGANGLSVLLEKGDAIDVILNGVLTEYLDVRVDCSALNLEEVKFQKSLLNETEYPNIRWIADDGACNQYFVSTDKRVQSLKSLLNAFDTSKEKADVIVQLSKNLLFEIASLRAIRALIGELGIGSYNIIAQYEVEGSNELGDYNLIEKTYKVMSGILGGANSILTPYKDNEESRLTLNIHNILDLESGMKNVLDPLAGSYYLEKLTGEIIRQVKED